MTLSFDNIALVPDTGAAPAAVVALHDVLATRLNARVTILNENNPKVLLEQLERGYFGCIAFYSPGRLHLDRTTLIWNLLDRIATPVVLIPKNAPISLDLEALIVPVSAEPIASAAASAALDLAERVNRPVELIRVGCTSEFCTCETSVLDSYTDAFHHEYLPRFKEIITNAAPWSSSAKKQLVRDTCHCCCQHIVDLIHHHGGHDKKLIGFEWSTELFRRDLGILEEAINQAPCKFLFVKPGARANFVLKVGHDFFVA